MTISKQVIRKKTAKFPHSIGFVILKLWCKLHEMQSGESIDVEVQLNGLIITIPDVQKEAKK